MMCMFYFLRFWIINFRTSSTLVFIASRYDDNGSFFCKGINQVLKNRNEAPLIQTTSLQVLCKSNFLAEFY